MATSKSPREVKRYPCKGGCGRTLTYIKGQRCGAPPVWCKECYNARRNEKRRKGGTVENPCAEGCGAVIKFTLGQHTGLPPERCDACRRKRKREQGRAYLARKAGRAG